MSHEDYSSPRKDEQVQPESKMTIAEMKQFEYLIEEVDVPITQTQLNEMGLKGWELISFSRFVIEEKTKLAIIYKREINHSL